MQATRTMRAQRLYTDTNAVVVEDVPIPEPGAGQVLVKVAFCGICHSDLSLITRTVPSRLPVVTQGHEASGTIAKLGPDVSGWSEGERVIVSAARACLTCANCRCGDPANCLNLQLMAFDYDGAWAQYTLAQAIGLTRVPDGVSMEQAAILADAVATPYGAVVRTAKVRLGESVGVWGLGGIGSHIVQLARISGAAPILAVDTEADVLSRAIKMGADFAIDSRDKRLGERIAEMTGGRRLDVAFDAVGLKAPFEQALRNVAVGGRLVAVGVSGEAATIDGIGRFTMSQKQILGHLGYKNTDIQTLAKLVSCGRLDLSRSISGIIALEDIADGLARLQKGIDHPVRILIRP